jgi:hypothetical protein
LEFGEAVRDDYLGRHTGGGGGSNEEFPATDLYPLKITSGDKADEGGRLAGAREQDLM